MKTTQLQAVFGLLGSMLLLAACETEVPFQNVSMEKAFLSLTTTSTDPIGTDLATIVDDCPTDPSGGSCSAGQVAFTAEVKCHTGGSNPPGPIPCVMQYELDHSSASSEKHRGTIATWVKPSGHAQASPPEGCANVGVNSLIARLGDLPRSCAQYHFNGKIKGCVSDVGESHDEDQECPTEKGFRKALSGELVRILAEANAPRVTIDSARKGDQSYPLTGPASHPYDLMFCAGHGMGEGKGEGSDD